MLEKGELNRPPGCPEWSVYEGFLWMIPSPCHGSSGRMFVYLQLKTLFCLHPSAWPSGTFKHVRPYQRRVPAAVLVWPRRLQNTTQGAKLDSSPWIFPPVALQRSGKHGDAFGGASGPGHQRHSPFPLFCIFSHPPAHLLHPQWLSAIVLPERAGRRSADRQVCFSWKEPLLYGGVGTVGREPGTWKTGFLYKLSRSCDSPSKTWGEN